MSSPDSLAHPQRGLSPAAWLGVALALAGLMGHLLAAQAIGGYWIAYRDHVFGFFLILAVTGGVIAWLGARFWPGRRDRTILLIGVVQALLGLFVYLDRFRIGSMHPGS